MRLTLPILLISVLLFLESIGLSVSANSPPAPLDTISSECSEPTTWRVGTIDSRFNIKETEVKNIMRDVENLWSDAVEKNLLQYSDSGEVAINLIYSEEQKFTDNEQKLSEQINEMRKKYYSMRVDYQQESVRFRDKLNQYNTTFTEYANKVNEYNLRLSRLTNNGIVSRDDDEKLKNLKKEMEFLEKKLDPLEEELTVEEQNLNRLSEELNDYADEVNEYVFQYRNRYSQSRTFFQGFYTNVGNQKKVNIYQFENLNKLKLVLAHEFGHVLGLSHNENPVSIMNYNMRLQNEERLKLSDQDIQSIQNKCGLSQTSR